MTSLLKGYAGHVPEPPCNHTLDGFLGDAIKLIEFYYHSRTSITKQKNPRWKDEANAAIYRLLAELQTTKMVARYGYAILWQAEVEYETGDYYDKLDLSWTTTSGDLHEAALLVNAHGECRLATHLVTATGSNGVRTTTDFTGGLGRIRSAMNSHHTAGTSYSHQYMWPTTNHEGKWSGW